MLCNLISRLLSIETQSIGIIVRIFVLEIFNPNHRSGGAFCLRDAVRISFHQFCNPLVDGGLIEILSTLPRHCNGLVRQRG